VFAPEDDLKHTDYALDMVSNFVDYYSDLIGFNYTNSKLGI